jgi:methyl-accepting chemotaxis protein
MTGNLNLAAQGCREIARNILVVSKTASGTADNAEHVRQFAEQLAAMAGELDRLCAQQRAATTSQQVILSG